MRKKKMFYIHKIKLKTIIEQEYNVVLNDEQLIPYTIMQQDNHMFRAIRNITFNATNRIDEMVFVDATIGKTKQEELSHILRNGFILNGFKYVLLGKSASMAKDGTIGFIREKLHGLIEQIIMMDIKMDSCVISKFEAYKNLVFSSCEFVSKLPYIVIIDDYEKVIPNQLIKYVVEEEAEWVSKKDGKKKKGKISKIQEGIKDITINCFDGMGVHTPEISELLVSELEIEHPTASFQIRMPYVKGLSTQVDFKNYYKEHNITHILDMWGKKHKVEDIDCIWSKSMFKGDKYFKDWNEYLEKFYKYNFKLGISKYNKPTEEEEVYTATNFQYLQTLNLTGEQIIELSKYSTEWIEKIINGDKLYALKFLGKISVDNYLGSKYMKAISLHTDMLKDKHIQNFIYRTLSKKINGLKMGKVYIKGKYSFVVGDLVGFMQHAAQMDIVGCLGSKEYYSKFLRGKHTGFRSPLVHKSEINKMNFVENDLTEKWCNHLDNINMINMYDITMPQMGGMDLDGDIIFVTDNEIIYNAVEDTPIVVDINDKIATDKVPYIIDNIIQYHLRTLDSRIGEITNYASYYLNKENKHKYDDKVALLRILQGKEIDYVKTGVRIPPPLSMKQESRRLPYFFIYNYERLLKKYNKFKKIRTQMSKKIIKNLSGDYSKMNVPDFKSKVNSNTEFVDSYKKRLGVNNKFILHIKQSIYIFLNEKRRNSEEVTEKDINLFVNNLLEYPITDTKSNLNKLCHHIEKWERENFKWNDTFEDTYHLMMSKNIEMNQELYIKINDIYKDFNKQLSKLLYGNTKDYKDKMKILYDAFRIKCMNVVLNPQELANYCVDICYNKNKNSSFAWIVAWDGILLNLYENKQEEIELPIKTDNLEDTEYMGRYYKLETRNNLISLQKLIKD